MDPAERKRRLLNMLRQVAPEGSLEQLLEKLQARQPKSTTEGLEAGRPEGARIALGGETLDAGRPRGEESLALESLDNLVRQGDKATLGDAGEHALEAIIHLRLRPVIDVVNDTFDAANLEREWRHLGEKKAKKHIDKAILSVGRIEIPKDPGGRPYAGTGFVVGPNLLMTNRHVAELFATGVGQRNLRFHPGQIAEVNFVREILPRESLSLSVDKKIVMIHPHWDMALLRVSGLPEKHPTLTLSVTHPDDFAEPDVVAIGYPALDERNDLTEQLRIFRGIFRVKRLQPGKLKARRAVKSFGRDVEAQTHDCSTLGGNSGSAVVDISSGHVVALHFAGDYLDANYAVPTFDLAADSRVVNAGVKFTGQVAPGDLYPPLWKLADSGESPLPRAKPADPSAPVSKPQVNMPASTANWVIPIQISVSVGVPAPAGATPGVGVVNLAVSPVAPPQALVLEEEGLAGFSLDSLTTTSFDWRTALSLALASKLAYESAAAVEHQARNVWGLSTCTFIESGETQCFVASSPAAVLIAFRGTASLGDWLLNLNAFSIDQPYGTVHRGFYFGFQAVKARLEQEISQFPGRPVLLTGHSLGGALATIAAAEWRGRVPLSAIYTYGQPCVGKGDFPSYMTEHFGNVNFRFVNNDDIVPRVPPTYAHVGRLFHFDSLGNLKGGAESLSFDEPQAAPRVLSETQFERLKDQLRAEKARRLAAGISESVPFAPEQESIWTSFSDHKLAGYIQKIARRIS